MGNVAGVEIVTDVAALLAGGMDVDADALAKAQFPVHIVFCGWQGLLTCQQHGQFLQAGAQLFVITIGI